MRKNIKITVLGGGLWGTVLAQHLANAPGNPEVWLWEFFPDAAQGLLDSRRHPHIPGFRLSPKVAVTADWERATQGAAVLLFVLPSAFVRRTAARLKFRAGAARPIIVSASKGLEPKTLATMSEVLASEIRGSAVYALSGPSFAREVAQGTATTLVLAGPPGKRGDALFRLLNRGNLRVARTSDRRGAELGGALKNVLAIGCGVLDGLNAGNNAKAAFLVQGMAEMAEIAGRAGGRNETIYGPAGLGDLVLTGTSAQSRNRSFGEKLGSGKTPEEAKGEIATVVEGAQAAESAARLASRLKVKAPLLRAVCAVVRRRRPPEDVLKAMGFGTGVN